MRLDDFLLARLAEDEDRAREDMSTPGEGRAALHRIDVCRIRRDIAVSLAAARRGSQGADHLLRILARPYAGHPDFEADWRLR